MMRPLVLAKLLRVFWRMRLGKPTFVSFNSLNSCNEACPMCAVWRRDGARLSVAEMEPIFRDLRSCGFLVTEISGGEPFLREDIYEIVQLFDRLGFLYTIATNGTLLSAAALERLRSAKGLLQIAVSIDSLDRATYASLRGRDFLPILLENLEMLSKARGQLPVKLNMVMNRLNYRETFDLLAFSKERGLSLSVFPVNQGEGFSHRHSDDQFLPTDDERQEMAEIFRELARMRRAGEPLWEYSGFYELAADYVLGKPVGPCDAGGLYLDLNADGQIAVCPDRAGVGDLRQKSLRQLWPRLQAEQPAVKACSEHSPCLYTCTYNVSLTARNEGAFLWETVRVRLRSWLGRR
jgi:MoaA/NifB/PqqE/SkfB family radical SAM enzyme